VEHCVCPIAEFTSVCTQFPAWTISKTKCAPAALIFLHALCHLHTKTKVWLKFVELSVLPNIPDLNPVDYRVHEVLCSRACIALNFQPERSQRQSAHLLGESWPTDHRQIYWSLAWQTEGSGSTEWWTHWTIVLTIWFICCSALLHSVPGIVF